MQTRGAGWYVSYGSVGPSLYDGTAGIALFLAQVAALTGDREIADTARAGIRHAPATPTGSTGLYTGATGVALAATRVALLLSDEELLVGTQDTYAAVQPTDREGFDLMSGDAGRAIGMVCLGRMWNNDELLANAVEVGRRLVRSGYRGRSGLCWRPSSARGSRPLLGLSHGAAGAALALLRLYDCAHGDWLADAASEAFHYENVFFSLAESNWPDLRDVAGRGKSLTAPYQTMWCHGAPGIALSRLEAVRILRTPQMSIDLTRAVDTTRRAVELALHRPGEGFSLCHGLGGNADVLLSCGDVSGRGLCRNVGDYGIRQYSQSGEWPCGVTSAGLSPGLFLGTAGIGYFYLRLAADVPSVLNLDPITLATAHASAEIFRPRVGRVACPPRSIGKSRVR